MLKTTLLPSLKACRTTLFDETTGGLFLLSLISVTRLLEGFGWVTLGTVASWVVAIYDDATLFLLDLLLDLGVNLPVALVDGLVLHSYMASVVAQTEADELLAVDTTPELRAKHLDKLLRSLRRGRTDMAMLALPDPLRPWFVRLLWPLLLPYRAIQPYVVTGPGPSGHTITTTVAVRDMPAFRDRLTAAGVWTESRVVDIRLLLALNLALILAASALASQI